LLIDLQFIHAHLFYFFQMGQVILQKDFGIGNRVHSTDKDERNLSVFARVGRVRFIVPFNFHTNNVALVDNLLDNSTVLSDDFADQTARHLNRFFAILEHTTSFSHALFRISVDAKCTRVLHYFDVGNTVDFTCLMDISAVSSDRQAHQILPNCKFFGEPGARVSASTF